MTLLAAEVNGEGANCRGYVHRLSRSLFRDGAAPPMSTAPAAAPRLVATICSGRPPTANGRRYTSVNDEVRAIARREAAGKPTLTAKARALYDWGWDHMQYDKSVPGFGLGDIPYCLKVGKATAPTTWAFSLAYGDGTPVSVKLLIVATPGVPLGR